MQGHKEYLSKSLTYYLVYDEEAFPSQLSPIFMNLHAPKLYAQVHDVSMKYKAQRHMQQTRMTIQALWLYTFDPMSCLS